MGNETNSAGRNIPSPKNRTSFFITSAVLPGQSLPFPATGTTFYVTAANGSLNIKPDTGATNKYSPGTGLQLDILNAFSLLQVSNDNAFPVAFQLFVGFDGYIDNRVILSDSAGASVVYPTYPTANAAISVAINDISGQKFYDLAGKGWFALSRQSVIISNNDGGVDLLLQKSGSIISNGPAVATIFARTALRLDVAGNYSISTGGGNINAIVSEIYLAIPA